MLAGQKLSLVMKHMRISNAKLARTINIDASLVSRWLSGKRKIVSDSDYVRTMVLFFCNYNRPLYYEWLKSLLNDYDSLRNLNDIEEMCRCLEEWICTDDQDNDACTQQDELTGVVGRISSALSSTASLSVNASLYPGIAPVGENDVLFGVKGIALALENISYILGTCNVRHSLKIFYCCEEINFLHNRDFKSAWVKLLNNNNLKNIRTLTSVGSNETLFNELISDWIPHMLTGRMSLDSVDHFKHSFFHNAYFIIDGIVALAVWEPFTGDEEPFCILFKNPSKIVSMSESYEKVNRLSKPLVRYYGDYNSKDVLHELYNSYAQPGILREYKDTLNMLFLSLDGYERMLRSLGIKDKKKLEYRISTFDSFRKAYYENAYNFPYQTIQTLECLNDIVKSKMYKLPGIYLLIGGVYEIRDKSVIIENITNFMEEIQRNDNLEVLLLDNRIGSLKDLCWHIKASYSICVQSWKGKETVNIVSSQSYIVDEFNNFFTTKWEHSEEMRRNKNWVLSQIEKRLDLIKKG